MALHSLYKNLVATVLMAVVVVQLATATNVVVTMWNNLEGGQDAAVQCAPKGGYNLRHPLLYHNAYQMDVSNTDDYNCAFEFDGLLHWFHIYVGTRDGAICGDKLHLCHWEIRENGPCYIQLNADRTCKYKWDKITQN